MNDLQTIPIKDYLIKKGIKFKESGTELMTKCLFSGCDDDSREGEYHLYFNMQTSQYNCKKCFFSGNIVTLAKHLGDKIADIALDNVGAVSKPIPVKPVPLPITQELVEKCQNQLTSKMKEYLEGRGLSQGIVTMARIGYGEFYGRNWITMPIKDVKGSYSHFKLRRDPFDDKNPDKGRFYPTGNKASIYGVEELKNYKYVTLAEGEMDCLILLKNGIPAVCGTAGAQTFKKEWLPLFEHLEQVFVCYDNDQGGKDGVKRVVELLSTLSRVEIFNIELPDEVGDKGDVTDYFVKLKKTPQDFFKLAKLVNNLDEERVVQIKEAVDGNGEYSQPFPFGYPHFEEAMIGGVREGDLVIITGLSSHGKTTLAQNISVNLAKNAFPSIWFSYEVLMQNLFAKFKVMGAEDMCLYTPKRTASGNLEWIQNKIEEGVRNFGTKFVFIDHIDFVTPKNIKNSDQRRNVLSNITQELKDMAREMKLIIFLVSHLNKVKGREPEIQDISESSGIYKIADFVFCIKRIYKLEKKGGIRSKVQIKDNECVIYLWKNRLTGEEPFQEYVVENNIIKLQPLSTAEEVEKVFS